MSSDEPMDIDQWHLQLLRGLAQAGRQLEAKRAQRRAQVQEIFLRHPAGPERVAAVEAVQQDILVEVVEQLEAAMGIGKPH